MGLNLIKCNWEGVQASEPGEFTRLPAGAYVCKIYDAHLDGIRGKGLLFTLDVDIVEGDFAGFFEKRNSSERGWDFNARFKRYAVNAEKLVTPQFKGLIQMLEKQNPNFKFDPSNFDPAAFRDLICGFTFGEREYLDKKTDEIKIAVSIRFPVPAEKVRAGEVKTPPLEKLPDHLRPVKQADDSSFDGSPVDDDDFPF